MKGQFAHRGTVQAPPGSLIDPTVHLTATSSSTVSFPAHHAAMVPSSSSMSFPLHNASTAPSSSTTSLPTHSGLTSMDLDDPNLPSSMTEISGQVASHSLPIPQALMSDPLVSASLLPPPLQCPLLASTRSHQKHLENASKRLQMITHLISPY